MLKYNTKHILVAFIYHLKCPQILVSRCSRQVTCCQALLNWACNPSYTVQCTTAMLSNALQLCCPMHYHTRELVKITRSQSISYNYHSNYEPWIGLAEKKRSLLRVITLAQTVNELKSELLGIVNLTGVCQKFIANNLRWWSGRISRPNWKSVVFELQLVRPWNWQ